jgi:SAM-dependent methyltransferase
MTIGLPIENPTDRGAEGARARSLEETPMDDSRHGQVTRSAAEIYDEFFLPALFLEWTGPLAEAAAVASGQRVLDVACGTGAFACDAARRVQPGGAVIGLDRNDGMLAVARRKAPGIEWRQGRAESLPFADGSFDAVGCQFALMFFEDRIAALKEMWRVLKPGGRLAVAVWEALERSPGYAALAALLDRLFGARLAEALRAPFVLGEPETLRALFTRAGIAGTALSTRLGTARFPSLEAWIRTEIKGWTLADLIDEPQFERLRREAGVALQDFVQPDGTVAFASPAHIVSAVKS